MVAQQPPGNRLPDGSEPDETETEGHRAVLPRTRGQNEKGRHPPLLRMTAPGCLPGRLALNHPPPVCRMDIAAMLRIGMSIGTVIREAASAERGAASGGGRALSRPGRASRRSNRGSNGESPDPFAELRCGKGVRPVGVWLSMLGSPPYKKKPAALLCRSAGRSRSRTGFRSSCRSRAPRRHACRSACSSTSWWRTSTSCSEYRRDRRRKSNLEVRSASALALERDRARNGLEAPSTIPEEKAAPRPQEWGSSGGP